MKPEEKIAVTIVVIGVLAILAVVGVGIWGFIELVNAIR